MRTARPLLLVLPLAALVPLAGALPWSKSRPVPAADPLPAAADAEAERLLDRAVEAADPDAVPWLETGFRQRVRLPGLAYEAEGDYRTGPGRRFRLELRTKVGQACGTLVLVGDGRYLWRGTRVGDRPWSKVTRAAARPDDERDEDGLNFSGVAPLLRNLRARMKWVRHEAGEGGQVTLTGVWTEEARRAVSKDKRWPAGLPTRCRLTLDADGWPRRVEWWGPAVEGGGPELLVEMDFRDAVRDRALPPAQADALFAFDPGNAVVVEKDG
jgi:hypothetical protein